MTLFITILLACNQPDPCAEMCSASTQVYGACLEEWGADWQAAGHEDARDYFHTCETWAWELRLLERDAKRSGDIDELGHVDQVCQSHDASLRTAEDPCQTWSNFDWNDLPW